MSWWNRRKPESIWCDLEGLKLLIDDINTDVGMSEIVYGPAIRVRPGYSENKDLVYVTLEPYLIDRLRRRVRDYEYSDVYGPRSRSRTGGGASDGTS